MTEKYGCVECGSEFAVTRTKVDNPTDPKDIPYEIVTFSCPTCENEFEARSPPHPHPRRN